MSFEYKLPKFRYPHPRPSLEWQIEYYKNNPPASSPRKYCEEVITMSIWSACRDKYRDECDSYVKSNPQSSWIMWAKEKFEGLSEKEREEMEEAGKRKL